MIDPVVLFVLPAPGSSGGANSVVREATELGRLGMRVGIAVDDRNYNKFIGNYESSLLSVISVHRYRNAEDLASTAVPYNIIVATVCASVATIKAARKILLEKNARHDHRIAYYVQDYEPLFFQEGSVEWEAAYKSYSLIDDVALFAKTEWLRKIVYDNHGRSVAKVAPSIDHDIYWPNFGRSADDVHVVAMVRPHTVRRAPHRTLRILHSMASRSNGLRFTASIFGADDEEIANSGMDVPAFVVNRGRLRRHAVPDLLRTATLFLDLSDYQAFGRTALEGMACGVVPIVPRFGGVSEFAVHGHNAYVVDTRNDEAILEAIDSFLSQSDIARHTMRMNALETASTFSARRAALTEYKLFSQLLN